MIVVDTDPDIAVERLVDHRGFTEADARARMARQASRERAPGGRRLRGRQRRARSSELEPQIEALLGLDRGPAGRRG